MVTSRIEREAERLDALYSLDLLDTPEEPFFDAIVAAVSAACAAPIALVSLVDRERQWFKAKVGLDACETGRDVSFCTHTIEHSAPLVVPDALADPRFCDNPLVHGPPFVRAYAGAPIITSAGHALGTLCVIHHEPTWLRPDQIALLQALAASVAAHLDLRAVARTVRQKQDLLLRFVREAPVAIAMLDREMTFISASGSWADLFHRGCTPVGQNVYVALPGSRERYGEAHQRALAGETVGSEADVVARRGGDGALTIRWEIRPWHEASGAVGGLLIVAEDITAQRKVMRDLDRQTRRLNLALQLAQGAVWELDPATGAIEVSDSMRSALGDTPPVGPMRLRDFLRYIPSEDRAPVRRALRTHLAGGPGLDLDHRLQRLDGAVVWVRTFAERVIDAETGGPRFIGFLKNITARKTNEIVLAQALAAEQSARKAQSEFMANISHEIRTPLNGVIGLAGVLGKAALPADEARLVRTIQESGAHLERLLTDLLDFSKIDAGALQLEPIAFDPLAQIASVIDLLRPQAQSKGLALTFTARLDHPTWHMGDPVRLKQVAANLISNAIKFTETGSVVVRATLDPADRGSSILRLDVTDTGIGMSPASLERLFTRFAQADASINRRFGGTGLGLAISKALVDMMGGEIQATSTLGGGTTFTVRVPLMRQGAEQAQSAATTDPAEVDGSALAGCRILAVDDHPVNRKVVELILTPFQVRLDLECGGRDALAALASGAYDLVLMDMHMPDIDGLTVVREVRRRERERAMPATPILMLSASATQRDREQAALAGADGLIAKPVTPERLVSALSAALACRAQELPPPMAR